MSTAYPTTADGTPREAAARDLILRCDVTRLLIYAGRQPTWTDMRALADANAQLDGASAVPR